MKPSDSRQTCCDSARSWQILGFPLTFRFDQHGRDRWREYWRDVFEPTCSRTCKSNLGPTPRGYGSLAIRGRRAVTQHDLGKFSAFFNVSLDQHGRDRWREYGRDFWRQHTKKTSESFEKSPPDPPKASRGAFKIEPGALQDAILKRSFI